MRNMIVLNADDLDKLRKGEDVPCNMKDGSTIYISLEKITVRELLENRARPEEFAIFLQNGFQIGCTYVDYAGLFIESLNDQLLNKRVKAYRYEKQPWSDKEAIIIEV